MNTTQHNTLGSRISTQVSAFGLALLVTLATMSSLNHLAVSEHAATELAAASSPATQQVVIVGKRAPRA